MGGREKEGGGGLSGRRRRNDRGGGGVNAMVAKISHILKQLILFPT